MPKKIQSMHGRMEGSRNFAPTYRIGPRTLTLRALLTVLILVLATAVSWAFGETIANTPFAFYFPAVMIAAVLNGWEMGIVATAVGGLVAAFLFMPPYSQLTVPTPRQWVSTGIFLLAALLQVGIAQWLRMTLGRLERSENRFRQLASATSGFVWSTDPQGRVIEPQPGWTQLTGMTWPGYSEHKWINSIHEDDREKIIPNSEALDAGFHHIEFRMWNASADNWHWYAAHAVPIVDQDGRLSEWLTTVTDIHERKLAREHREMLIGELRHRLKNLFTVIGSLAQSSRPRNSPAVDEFLNKLNGRLHALSAAADLVVASGHVTIEMRAMIQATLVPFMEEDSTRFEIDGPEIPLAEETGGSLALAIHELATNALKYGALSVPDGRVAIVWTRETNSEGEWVALTWKERGGPPPVEPEKLGFGTRVIKFSVSRERAGDVQFDYAPDGLRCHIRFLKSPNEKPAPISALAES